MNANQLKKSILQYAIEGKLVVQNTSDASASELLKKISKQKERMIKEKIIKKEKSIPLITDEEVPFDIPDAWTWVRLKSISTFGNFNQATPEKIDTDAWVLDLEEIEKNTGRILEQKLASEKIIKSNKYKFNQNDVLYGKLRPYLNKVTIAPQEGYCTTEIFPITLIEGIYSKYIQSVLMSPYFLNYAHRLSYGVKMPRLGTEQLANTLIPLPPTNEQIRIVDKIEELFLKINSYDNHYLALEALNERFPKDLGKSILQYAIEGKLTDQGNSDKPASELLKRITEQKEQMIKEKKIKKEKMLPHITEEEIPFDIPDTWEWIRLGQVISLLSGQDFSPENYNDTQNGIPYITGASTLSKDGVLLNRWTETPKCIVSTGDLLLVCKGSGFGKTVICDIEKAHIARQIMSIKKNSLLNIEYVKLFLDANINQIKKSGQGVIPGIDRQSILNMVFPLPPLEEQATIVQLVREIKLKINKLQ